MVYISITYDIISLLIADDSISWDGRAPRGIIGLSWCRVDGPCTALLLGSVASPGVSVGRLSSSKGVSLG